MQAATPAKMEFLLHGHGRGILMPKTICLEAAIVSILLLQQVCCIDPFDSPEDVSYLVISIRCAPIGNALGCFH